MSRFELIDATSERGTQFYITDTRTARSYEAPDSFERASHALMTLNALKPLWFASTYMQRVFVDVRVEVGGNLYSDAQIIDARDMREEAVIQALRTAIMAMESRLHKYVALHG